MKSFFIAHPAKGTGSVTKRLLSSPASKAYGNASCYGIDASCAHRLHLLEDSATSLLLVSCTEWCAGQGYPATFLLRFQDCIGAGRCFANLPLLYQRARQVLMAH